MRSIQDMLPSDDQQITLGILIGSNCPNALEPIKIIPSKESGPYAFKPALGWCVSGPMSSSSSKSIAIESSFGTSQIEKYQITTFVSKMK